MMYEKFINILAWTTGAASIYKIALLSHQIALYAVMPTPLYGLQTTLFALLYCAIACTNFGFDDTLLPFFAHYRTQQLSRLAYLHAIMLASCACIFMIIVWCNVGAFLHNLQGYCNKKILFCIIFIFLIESMKRSLTAIMQLAFFTKQIAFGQVGMLYAYIATVWGLYWWYGTINLMTIFAPMALYSLLEFCYLMRYFVPFLQTLNLAPCAPSIPFKVFISTRVANYLNQLAKVVYNQNSMTLFFVYAFGFTQAATIKFFTNIITLCYTCLAKSIGIASGVTLASQRHLDNQLSTQQTQSLFRSINFTYLQFLAICTSLIAVMVWYAYHIAMLSLSMVWYIMIFFIIGFLDHVGIVYEQFFIVHRRSWLLATIQIAALSCMAICWYVYRCMYIDTTFMIACFVMIKIVLVSSIGLLAFFSIK